MFICGTCDIVQAPKVASHPHVVEQRFVDYNDSDGNFISSGTEIVKEIRICPTCRAEAEIFADMGT